MQDEEWDRESPMEGQQVVEEFDLNAGGLVGAVAGIEGTGQLVTGTRNDESGLSLDGGSNPPVAAAAALGNRLTVHSIRDTQGQVLGLGPHQQRGGGGDEGGQEAARGWEPVVEAWTAHEEAVTGIGVVGGYGMFGDASGVVTSGGDGCLRMFELALGDQNNEGGGDAPAAAAPGPSLTLKGQVAAHLARATGVASIRRRAVTVGEDGLVCLIDLQRLDGGTGRQRGGGGGGAPAADCVTWTGRTTGELALSGVTFQGESEEVFATVGCDPQRQLMVWDARAKGSCPVHKFGYIRGSGAPYVCVASQPFNPEVFACGSSTGDILLWDVRTGGVHEMQVPNKRDLGAATWGVAFHPRRPRHLFSCTGTGALMKWYLPPEGKVSNFSNGLGGNGGNIGTSNNSDAFSGFGQPSRPEGGGGGGGGDDLVWQGANRLHALPSRSALVGVCYDEGADTISAVSKHGHVVVAQGVPGLRL